MKTVLITIALLMSQMVLAHDEGHGPKLVDQPKFGGKVAAVIDKSEIKKGTKATLLYKAELTKNNQNVVRIYLYDKDMKPLTLESFKDASVELQFKDKKTKKWGSHEFKLEKKDNAYVGKLPKSPRRPFNIDVNIDENAKTLFMAFDNLN